MAKTNMIISFALVILLAVFFQVLFVFADTRETPERAAREFAEAYVNYNREALVNRLCETNLIVDGANVVDAYLHRQAQRAKSLGYSLFWMKDCLYHLEMEILSSGNSQARIHLTAERKSPLRRFFGGKTQHVDETLDLVREEGKWKVCGGPFSLPEA